MGMFYRSLHAPGLLACALTISTLALISIGCLDSVKSWHESAEWYPNTAYSTDGQHHFQNPHSIYMMPSANTSVLYWGKSYIQGFDTIEDSRREYFSMEVSDQELLQWRANASPKTPIAIPVSRIRCDISPGAESKDIEMVVLGADAKGIAIRFAGRFTSGGRSRGLLKQGRFQLTKRELISQGAVRIDLPSVAQLDKPIRIRVMDGIGGAAKARPWAPTADHPYFPTLGIEIWQSEFPERTQAFIWVAAKADLLAPAKRDGYWEYAAEPDRFRRWGACGPSDSMKDLVYGGTVDTGIEVRPFVMTSEHTRINGDTVTLKCKLAEFLFHELRKEEGRQ